MAGFPFQCPKCGAVSYHPDDLKNGYCGKCHEYTAPPLVELQIEKERVQKRLEELVREGVANAQKIRDMFTDSAPDYMMMLLTIHILIETYPGLMKFTDAKRFLTEWVIAGEPEILSEVPGRMLEKLGPEAYQKYEEGVAKLERKQ
jgi:hypothetical protein